MKTETKKILNQNFSEYADWPFAESLPGEDDFAFPLDKISNNTSGDAFHHIIYLEITHHNSVMPTYIIKGITKIGNYPALHNQIYVSGNHHFRTLLEKLTAVVDVMEKIGPTTTEAELKSVLSGEE